MPLPSCAGSRSWLRNPPRATTSKQTSQAAPRAIRIPPPDRPLILEARLAHVERRSRSSPRQSGLAERADEALLGDVGNEHAILKKAARR
jgi:hypothetical protein